MTIAKDAISASRRGRNVYADARTVRPNLKGNQRGKIEDTIAVFPLTVDSDADEEKLIDFWREFVWLRRDI
jgi:hypothetical protein